MSASPLLRRVVRLLARLVPLLAVGYGLSSWLHLPSWQVQPALLGLACYTVGNYLFCPLRWRAVSTADRPLRWYGRVYAEGELLGMLTPQHAGADLWRVRQLTANGLSRTAAVLEVATDRLSGGVVIFALAMLAGMRTPPAFWPAVGGGVVVLVLLGWLTRRLWRPRLASVPRIRGSRLLRAAAVSSLYQAGYLGFMLGLVAAVGHHVSPLDMMSLVGLSQIAGLLPGVHGAGPKEGTLAGGLVAFGVPLSAAVAVVALAAALTWVPAIAVGGSGLAARAWRRRR